MKKRPELYWTLRNGKVDRGEPLRQVTPLFLKAQHALEPSITYRKATPMGRLLARYFFGPLAVALSSWRSQQDSQKVVIISIIISTSMALLGIWVRHMDDRRVPVELPPAKVSRVP